MQITKKIGKIAALVGVCPGFVGNRMLAQRGREAQALLDEGAMPWDVDRALYEFGFAMGPFQMMDLAGLDIGWVKERSDGATDPRPVVRARPAGPEDGRRLLRLRRQPQRRHRRR